MSRNLYTIAAIVPSVLAELQSLLAHRPDEWWRGAGERLLADRISAQQPLVACYSVVLDGWSRGLKDLVEWLGPACPPEH